ncbi:hypothetical protein L1987_52323 [Smallanthus sonchifolius]|uniref:Uncharacterized protein n=1 Tax=Smallanthus sonchifolius TaxID=185202 RepID=A0ACB9ETE3_9ASTR|nr:hypothetical protein L1987_52323 [Smallanthus sonchifolius]
MSAVWRARRNLSTAAGDCPRLIRFALHPPNNVKVEFADGSRYKLPAEYLRVLSPAVDSKIRSVGGEKFLICDLWAPSCRDYLCRTCRKLRGKVTF